MSIPNSNTCSFYQQYKAMVDRVFHGGGDQYEISFLNTPGHAHIGLDRRYVFSKHLNTAVASQIRPADFYVRVKKRLLVVFPEQFTILKVAEFVLKKVFLFLQPPSSEEEWVSKLFNDVQESERVSFSFKKKKFSYVCRNVHVFKTLQERHRTQLGKTFEEWFKYPEDLPRAPKPLNLFVHRSIPKVAPLSIRTMKGVQEKHCADKVQCTIQVKKGFDLKDLKWAVDVGVITVQRHAREEAYVDQYHIRLKKRFFSDTIQVKHIGNTIVLECQYRKVTNQRGCQLISKLLQKVESFKNRWR